MTKNTKPKILFVAGPGEFNVQAGGEVQLIKTMEYLRKLGLKVDIFSPYNTNISDYDIMHIFGPSAFPMWSYQLAQKAKRHNVKVVISSIFWLTSYNSKTLLYLIKTGIISKAIFGFSSLVPLSGLTYLKRLFEECDAILPNTNEEKEMVATLFALKQKNKYFFVVPNGVDRDFKNGNSALFSKKYGLKGFILFVGRIEQRKNVLQLIREFEKANLDINLVIIGSKPNNAYYLECRRAASKKVIFLDPIPHDSPMLKSAYKCCDTLVLPSNVETPGLVALEAGLAGAKIAITEIGGTREYFEHYATYINPFKSKSIGQALITSTKLRKNSMLKNRIIKHFTWTIVAKKTLEAYIKILD